MEREFSALKGLMGVNGLDGIVPDIGKLNLISVDCDDLGMTGCKDSCKDGGKDGCKDCCKTGNQHG